MFQTKEQKTEISEKEKVEISNLSNKEFKVNGHKDAQQTQRNG